ncbi:SMP-30/gluconolactonase/LRE family protein [Burkholderia sp. Bp9142]|uniref:SMP-30/gluconolactonase/LRE family protein n=1 Tax=Burkholderia sp. Bp9142 TaxID=2184573 RepID=UPI000F59F904|nr:SMP-30/gluconolactonase/LRE family protein [Burkholderia sp. Bp9142]RQR27584.1 SMP-30/gluconolactonase/LRE family protein [Burkholderia sp. Bp9142]
MIASQPVCVWTVNAELGEGPVWVKDEHAVYFVDIKARRIHRFSEETRQTNTWTAPSEPGFVVPLGSRSFVCGLRDGLYRFDTDNEQFMEMSAVERRLRGNRLNDGFVDNAGRLWFGSMDDAEKIATGSLYRLSDDGYATAVDTGYVITNGPASSPDGRTLYHNDTLKRFVYAFDVGMDGALSNKRVFASILGPGYPDGMAVDADGFVWVALFGGACIQRFSPEGVLTGQVTFPCSNVTKLTFGGDDLRTVYVTTAWKGLSLADRSQQPLAGGLFSFRSSTPGQPQMRCTKGIRQ